MALAALVLITGCRTCAEIGGWSQSVRNTLALLGVVWSAWMIACEIAAALKPSLRETADGSVILTALLGLCLAAAASASGAAPCVWCIAFWVGAGGSLLELIASDRKAAKLAVGSVVLVGIAVAAVVLYPPSSRELAGILPPPPLAEMGPRIGTFLPDESPLPKTGIVLVATRCAACLVAAAEEKVKLLRADGYAVTLAATENNQAVRETLHDLPFVGVTPEDYRALRLTEKGAPWLIQVENGRVVASANAQAFRTVEERR